MRLSTVCVSGWGEGGKAMRALAALTAAAGLLPLVAYGFARLTGTLPSRAAWYAQGGNHGPLWGGWAMWAVALPLPVLALALPLGTLAAVAMYWPQRRRLLWTALGLGLWAAQWSLLVLQAGMLLWTID